MAADSEAKGAKRLYRFSGTRLVYFLVLTGFGTISPFILGTLSRLREPMVLVYTLTVFCLGSVIVRNLWRLIRNDTPELKIAQDRLILTRFWYLGVTIIQIPFSEIGKVSMPSFGSMLTLTSKPGTTFSCNKTRFMGRFKPNTYIITPNGVDYGLLRQGIGGVWREEMEEIYEVLSRLPGVESTKQS